MSLSSLSRRACMLAALAALGLPHMAQAQGAASAPAQPVKAAAVSVISIVEHPALDAIRDGVKEALEAAGYTGDKLRWQYQSAQGNTGTAAQIARKYIGEQPDVIVAIATPSAQAVVAATKTIPVVYSGVTDPVAAQLVPSMQASGTNVTGVSDMLPLGEQADLIRRIVPGARRVGMVYNPGEANSVVVVQEFKRILPARGMELVEAAAPRTVDIASAARSLAGKVDVIYTNTDNNVISAYESLVKTAGELKIPLIAADTDSVPRGAVAAMGQDYRGIGRQTGRIVARILAGEKPGEIASETGKDLTLSINLKAAAAQGAQLSEEVIKDAKEVLR